MSPMTSARLTPNRWRTLPDAPNDLTQTVRPHDVRKPKTNQPGHHKSKAYNQNGVVVAPERLILAIAAEEAAPALRQHLEPHYLIGEASNVAAGIAQAQQRSPQLILLQDPADEAVWTALETNVFTYDRPIALLTAASIHRQAPTSLPERVAAPIPLSLDGVLLRSRVATLIQQYQRHRTLWQDTHGLGLDELSELRPSEIAFLGRTQRLIERQFADPLFSTADLAEALRLSDRQLRRKTGTLLQQKPNALIRRFRLAQAAVLLQEGRLPIRTVALRAGFSSHARFSVAFRERYGVTPSAYAAAHRNFTPRASKLLHS